MKKKAILLILSVISLNLVACGARGEIGEVTECSSSEEETETETSETNEEAEEEEQTEEQTSETNEQTSEAEKETNETDEETNNRQISIRAFDEKIEYVQGDELKTLELEVKDVAVPVTPEYELNLTISKEYEYEFRRVIELSYDKVHVSGQNSGILGIKDKAISVTPLESNSSVWIDLESEMNFKLINCESLNNKKYSFEITKGEEKDEIALWSSDNSKVKIQLDSHNSSIGHIIEYELDLTEEPIIIRLDRDNNYEKEEKGKKEVAEKRYQVKYVSIFTKDEYVAENEKATEPDETFVGENGYTYKRRTNWYDAETLEEWDFEQGVTRDVILRSEYDRLEK